MRLLLIAWIVTATLSAAEEKKKELQLPTWNARETAFTKKALEKLDALPGEDPRKALKSYLEFLQEPGEGKADKFVDAIAEARGKAGKPLTGIGLFNGDTLFCTPSPENCGYSLGNLTDKHLAPLLKQAFAPAIQVAIAAFAAAAPNHLESMSYYAAFRVPKLVTRHPAEVYHVLHKLRDRLAKWNPGARCYDFKFFDRHPTPQAIKAALPAAQAEELISACAKGT